MLKWGSFPKALQTNVKNAFIIHGPIPFTFRNTTELIYHAWIQLGWVMRSTGVSFVKKDNSITTDAKVLRQQDWRAVFRHFPRETTGDPHFYFQKALFIDIFGLQENSNSQCKKKNDIPGSGYCLCMVEILVYTGILEILCIYLQSLNGIATVGMIALIFVCLFHDSDKIEIVNTFVYDHYKCYNQ